MPRRKSFQALFVETILFVSLFALVGHLSLNFWERYVVQTELSKMKTSLHTLKETINHIGIAYNQLYKELQGLADIAEGETVKLNTMREKHDRPTTWYTDLAQELLEDIQVQAMFDGGLNIKDAQKIKTEKTQTVENKVTQIALNATSKQSLQPKRNKKDKNLGDISYRNKKLQHNIEMIQIKTLNSKDMKNTGTVTKNHPKSIAAGTDEIAKMLDSISPSRYKENNPKQDNIHKCQDNHYCASTESSNFDFARF